MLFSNYTYTIYIQTSIMNSTQVNNATAKNLVQHIKINQQVPHSTRQMNMNAIKNEYYAEDTWSQKLEIVFESEEEEDDDDPSQVGFYRRFKPPIQEDKPVQCATDISEESEDDDEDPSQVGFYRRFKTFSNPVVNRIIKNT